jgi:hypothetical protein
MKTNINRGVPALGYKLWRTAAVLGLCLMQATVGALEGAETSALFPSGMEADLGRLFSGLTPQCGAPEYPKDSPGGVKVLGNPAFPLLSSVNGENNHLGAAARYGKGRLAVLAHHGYRESILKTQNFGQGCDARFFENLLTWLTEGRANGLSSVKAGGGKMNLLAKNTYDIKNKSLAVHPSWPVQLVVVEKLDRSVLDPAVNPLVYVNEQVDASEAEALEAYLKNGGAVIWISRFWSLLSYPWKPIEAAMAPAKVQLADYPIVQLMKKAGIEPLQWGSGKALPVLTPEALKIQHPLVAVNYWKQIQAGSLTASAVPGLSSGNEQERLSQLEKTIQPLFATYPVSPAVASMVQQMKAALSAALHGSDKKLICKSAPLHCKVATLYYRNMTLAPSQPADPTADVFPGLVAASLPRLERVPLTIDASRPGHGYNNQYHSAIGYSWESTGLYAAPGETIKVEVSSTAATPGLVLYIGSHTDILDKGQDLLRAPRVALTQELKPGLNLVSSPFGGLIYIEPRQFGAITTNLLISGAVKAPYFRLGRDTDAAWQSQIQQPLAPWGELESKRMILTVPTAELKQLSQPNQVMQKWDNLLAKYDLFMGLSSAESGVHQANSWPWRIVPDIQPSMGYMHSGYPIMTHMDVHKTWIDERSVKPFLGSWGEWHELGHNTHLDPITWSGNTEVTCNLHSLNIEAARADPEKPVRDGDYDRTAAFMQQMPHALMKNPDIGVRLVFFHQYTLAYKHKDFWPRVHRAYREIAAGKSSDARLAGLPVKTDSDKINSFAIVASVISGENQLANFDAWGFPEITNETRGKINGFGLPGLSAPVWKMRSDCKAAQLKTPGVDCVSPPVQYVR